mgnify:CR=1 FL=1
MIDNDTILRFIAAHPGCTTAQISEAMHCPSNIIKNRCARMVESGVLYREHRALRRADGKTGSLCCFTVLKKPSLPACQERRRRLTSAERGDYTGERFLPIRYVPRGEGYFSVPQSSTPADRA